MKRTNIDSQQTHFIGCWNLENNELCNAITQLFENNKNLQKQGESGYGKNLKIKKLFRFFGEVAILYGNLLILKILPEFAIPIPQQVKL